MNRVSKVLFVTAASLALTGTALAQDTPADPPAGGDGGGGDGTGGDGTGGGDAGAGAAVGAEVGGNGVEAGAAVSVDLGEISRPYTNAASKVAVYADLQVVHVSFGDASATGEGLHLGGGYGITDKITAGVDYTAPVAGDLAEGRAGKGPLAAFGMFSLVDSDKMHIAASADFEFNLCGGVDAMGECSATKAIHAGLGARYLVAPKFAILTGAPFGPGPVGRHLSISLESSGPITFDLPIGVGLQAMPKLFAYLETNLFNARLANKPDGADSIVLLGSDIEKGGLGVPLMVGGLFAVNPMIDVGLQLQFVDLLHAGDVYGISLGGRYRM